MTKKIVINMQSGGDARPVARLVQLANQYNSQIHLEYHGTRMNAKSIMGMMDMQFINGMEVFIEAVGEDESDAVKALAVYLTEK